MNSKFTINLLWVNLNVYQAELRKSQCEIYTCITKDWNNTSQKDSQTLKEQIQVKSRTEVRKTVSPLVLLERLNQDLHQIQAIGLLVAELVV